MPKRKKFQPPEHITRKLLGAQDFADRSGMSLPWVRKAILGQKVITIRIGRKVLIPESELIRLVAEGMTPARAAQ
jgi:hypothetical protein